MIKEEVLALLDKEGINLTLIQEELNKIKQIEELENESYKIEKDIQYFKEAYNAINKGYFKGKVQGKFQNEYLNDKAIFYVDKDRKIYKIEIILENDTSLLGEIVDYHSTTLTYTNKLDIETLITLSDYNSKTLIEKYLPIVPITDYELNTLITKLEKDKTKLQSKLETSIDYNSKLIKIYNKRTEEPLLSFIFDAITLVESWEVEYYVTYEMFLEILLNVYEKS